jgi:trans-aconitate 2-methyltransferase
MAEDTTYTFGDSPGAIERLDLLAELFAESTEALLRRWGVEGAGVAVDLGCGPGHTAWALARVCRPRRLLAVDASPAMAAAAARRLAAIPGAAALVADVRAPLPLPAGADLIHARYLLAHLPDAVAALDGWCEQLRPGGRVLVDEIDHIDTVVEPFNRYLRWVTAMLADRGTTLFAGRVLTGHRPAETVPLGETLVTLPQPTAAVARMFRMNLAEWRRGPWARERLGDGLLDDLTAALDELTRLPADRTDIVWTHRQLAWTRTATP